MDQILNTSNIEIQILTQKNGVVTELLSDYAAKYNAILSKNILLEDHYKNTHYMENKIKNQQEMIDKLQSDSKLLYNENNKYSKHIDELMKTIKNTKTKTRMITNPNKRNEHIKDEYKLQLQRAHSDIIRLQELNKSLQTKIDEYELILWSTRNNDEYEPITFIRSLPASRRGSVCGDISNPALLGHDSFLIHSDNEERMEIMDDVRIEMEQNKVNENIQRQINDKVLDKMKSKLNKALELSVEKPLCHISEEVEIEFQSPRVIEIEIQKQISLLDCALEHVSISNNNNVYALLCMLLGG